MRSEFVSGSIRRTFARFPRQFCGTGWPRESVVRPGRRAYCYDYYIMYCERVWCRVRFGVVVAGGRRGGSVRGGAVCRGAREGEGQYVAVRGRDGAPGVGAACRGGIRSILARRGCPTKAGHTSVGAGVVAVNRNGGWGGVESVGMDGGERAKGRGRQGGAGKGREEGYLHACRRGQKLSRVRSLRARLGQTRFSGVRRVLHVCVCAIRAAARALFIDYVRVCVCVCVHNVFYTPFYRSG